MSADPRSRAVRANILTPGPVDTPLFEKRQRSGDMVTAKQEIEELTPWRRLATPEEVAAVALFLCSDEASCIVGKELVMDGGWKNV